MVPLGARLLNIPGVVQRSGFEPGLVGPLTLKDHVIHPSWRSAATVDHRQLGLGLAEARFGPELGAETAAGRSPGEGATQRWCLLE